MLEWKDVIRFVQKGNPEPDRRVERTEAEWRSLLTEEQYRVTRKRGTELPFSGQYCETHANGAYNCICCDSPLFDSSLKFDSNSGWPSFTEPVNEKAIKYVKDKSMGMVRVEVKCNVCNAHLGHVFPDGPTEGGLRYCINSICIRLKQD